MWNISENKPALLATQNLNVGAVFSMAFCRWVGGRHLCVCSWGGSCPLRFGRSRFGPFQRQAWLITPSPRPTPPHPRLAGLLACRRDSPLVLAAGGAKGEVSVWDTLCASGVEAHVRQVAPQLLAGRAWGSGDGGGGDQPEQQQEQDEEEVAGSDDDWGDEEEEQQPKPAKAKKSKAKSTKAKSTAPRAAAKQAKGSSSSGGKKTKK